MSKYSRRILQNVEFNLNIEPSTIYTYKIGLNIDTSTIYTYKIGLNKNKAMTQFW